jgi:hypothetical protein
MPSKRGSTPAKGRAATPPAFVLEMLRDREQTGSELTMTAPSLDGRRFRDVSEEPNGDVGAGTVFEYHQDGNFVWARYTGGDIKLGFLVGTRHANRMDFRYSHVTVNGETASGHCTSAINELPDGRLECHETWKWESRPGVGTSIVREVLGE